MATIIEKCVICGKSATMHIHGDAYCSECGVNLEFEKFIEEQKRKLRNLIRF